MAINKFLRRLSAFSRTISHIVYICISQYHLNLFWGIYGHPNGRPHNLSREVIDIDSGETLRRWHTKSTQAESIRFEPVT